MDVQMPVMDGYTATGKIRAWEAETGDRQPLPIIAMTAHAMAGDQERYLKDSGAESYVTKPVTDHEGFIELVRNLIIP